MADYGTSKLAWGVFRSVGLGSKQLLGNPLLPAVVFFRLSGQFRKTSSCEQDSFRLQTPIATRRSYRAEADKLGKVCQYLSRWKLGLSGFRNFRSTTTQSRLLDGDVFDEPASFKKRSINSYGRGRILISALAGSLAVGAYLSNLETVPYSKRTRLVLMSRQVEKEFGERKWKEVKKAKKDKILPRNHPTSVRVRSIMNKMIDALDKGLRDDKVWGGGRRMLFWKHDKESYLDHIRKWEVIVVDKPLKNAAYNYLGGKIVLYTGILNTLESDAEIAAIIGHEIGHAVGRHSAEKSVWVAFLASPALLLPFLDMDAVLKSMQQHSSYLSLSRKLELEADYIGLLLMASAGYDPRIGLIVEKKRSNIGRSRDESKSTHPSGEKRVRLLVQSQEEAMALYKESLSIRILDPDPMIKTEFQ